MPTTVDAALSVKMRFGIKAAEATSFVRFIHFIHKARLLSRCSPALHGPPPPSNLLMNRSHRVARPCTPRGHRPDAEVGSRQVLRGPVVVSEENVVGTDTGEEPRRYSARWRIVEMLGRFAYSSDTIPQMRLSLDMLKPFPTSSTPPQRVCSLVRVYLVPDGGDVQTFEAAGVGSVVT